MSEMIRLSYAELADRLGVSKEAAKSRARRAGWPRVMDNTGIARFSVPQDIFDTPDRHESDTVSSDTTDTPPVTKPDTGVMLAAIEVLRDALTRAETARSEADKRSLELAEQVGCLKAERDAARAEIEELHRVQDTAIPPTPKAASLAHPLRRKWWPFR